MVIIPSSGAQSSQKKRLAPLLLTGRRLMKITFLRFCLKITLLYVFLSFEGKILAI